MKFKLILAFVIVVCSLTGCKKDETTCTCRYEDGYTESNLHPEDYGVKTCQALENYAYMLSGEDATCF